MNLTLVGHNRLMESRRKLILLALVVIGLLALGLFARQSVADVRLGADNVIVTDHYRLSRAVDEPLVVIADTVTITNDSQVAGNAALVGRSAVTVDGRINGDLTVLGNTLAINRNSRVSGDAALMGNVVTVAGDVDGQLTVMADRLVVEPGARLNGEIVACVSAIDGRDYLSESQIRRCSENEALATFAPLQALRDGVSPDQFAQGFSAGLPFTLLGSILLAGLAALAVTLFPQQIGHLQTAVRAVPRSLAGTGCLAFLLVIGGVAGLVLVLAIAPPLGLILLPLALLVGLALLGMIIAGWIALALVLGDWLMRRATGGALPPLVDAAVGSLALLVVWNLLAALPFGALAVLLAVTVLGAVGLGAAVTTRMGTRPLRPTALTQV
jgi:hypothetical protein